MSLQGILLFSFRAVALALPVTLIFCLVRFFFLRKNQQKPLWKKEVLYAVLCFYLTALIQITVIRGGVSLEQLLTVKRSGETIQLVPIIYTLAELKNGLWAFIYPVVGNMIWFVPLGILLPLVNSCWKKLLPLCLTAFMLSFTIEAFQWIFGSGISDIDDILLNTLGALTGYFLLKISCHLYSLSTDK